MNRIILKPKREKSVTRFHPWVFSGAIQRTEGDLSLGTTAAVYSSAGEFLAWGHYSPHSQIRVRLFSWDETAKIDTTAFWEHKLSRAIRARDNVLADGRTTACRLVNAENDGLPGLVVDKYEDILVMQYLSAGMQIRKKMVEEILWNLLKPKAIYERSDADVRQKEGLPMETGLLMGTLPPELVEFQENGLRFLVDITQGQKSGFYLDQRQNRQFLRQLVQQQVISGKKPKLLNVFSYTGGFTVYGLDGGAISALNIDTSSEALALGRRILTLNNLKHQKVTDMPCDAFEGLRTLRREGKTFDIIILDPPKFAASQKDVRHATRGYKDINMQAFHLLEKGGYLLTFSCSGVISDDLFQKIVFGAAVDVKLDVQIVAKLTQSDDHPVALTFPEGAYLKGLVCRIT